MSKICGDTARYNRIRKQRSRHRAMTRALRAALLAKKAAASTESPKPTAPAAG